MNMCDTSHPPTQRMGVGKRPTTPRPVPCGGTLNRQTEGPTEEYRPCSESWSPYRPPTGVGLGNRPTTPRPVPAGGAER
jgi:hypothetical protein